MEPPLHPLPFLYLLFSQMLTDSDILYDSSTILGGNTFLWGLDSPSKYANAKCCRSIGIFSDRISCIQVIFVFIFQAAGDDLKLLAFLPSSLPGLGFQMCTTILACELSLLGLKLSSRVYSVEKWKPHPCLFLLMGDIMNKLFYCLFFL